MVKCSPDGLAAQIVAKSGLLPVGQGTRLLDRVYNALANFGMLERAGSVFLCAEAALQPSDVMFIGLNPGGSDEDQFPTDTLSESLSSTRLGVNAFDQDWSSDTRSYSPGASPLQARFKFIANYLGTAYGAMPALNLVFARSSSVSKLAEFDTLRERTSHVHKLIFEEIRPKKLWVMGDTDKAGSLLQHLDMNWEQSGHSNWAIGHGTGDFKGNTIQLCHTPHLSIWDPVANPKALSFAFNGSNWEANNL